MSTQRDRRGGRAANPSIAARDRDVGDGIRHECGVRDAIGAGRDLLDVVGGRVEDGLGEGDLVVGKVVDDVGGAQEGVAEQGGGAAGRQDAEEADLGAGRARDAADQHELVQRHLDRRAGELEVDGRVGVLQLAVDDRVPARLAVLRADGIVDARGEVIGQVGQAGAGVEERARGGGGGVAAGGAGRTDLRQGDVEGGVVAVRLDDGHGLERAAVLAGVNAAEQDRAGARVEIVEPEAVGIAVDQSRLHEALRDVGVGSRARVLEDGFVSHVADADEALLCRRVVANAKLLALQGDTTKRNLVLHVVACRPGAVEVGDVEEAVDILVCR